MQYLDEAIKKLKEQGSGELDDDDDNGDGINNNDEDDEYGNNNADEWMNES